MLTMMLALAEAIHWPVAFYLASVVIIAVLEPLASPNNKLCPKPIKNAIQALFSFGKTLDTKKNSHSLWMKYGTVPKSWFRHFYVVSSGVGVCSCCLVLAVSRGMILAPPTPLLSLLDLVTTPHRLPFDSSLLSLVSLLLLTVQCCARLHECYCVSVFSSSGTMNLAHYAVGYLHYLCAFATLLAASPVLQTGGSGVAVWLQRSDEVWRCVAGVALFMAGFVLQRHSMQLLARLRTNTDKALGRYLMPRGGAFDYVSCPHMAGEVVMYIAVSIVLHPTPACAAMLLFVITNQVQVALSNHRWYCATFPRYPVRRRALCPGLL